MFDSRSSTNTDRFIRGQTLYLFFCFGCVVLFILARGKSLSAGLGSLVSDLNLRTTSPCL